MEEIDPRLRSALAVQLERRRAALAGGARHVGWKLGLGERERIGKGPVVGHLTTATQLAPGGVYEDQAAALHADAEVALVFGPEAAIVGFAAALELVDLARPPDDPECVVAANVFHRAFALGPSRRDLPAGVEARLIVDGEARAAAAAPTEFAEKVGAAARILAAMGESLRPGDVMITGSVVQVPVAAGNEVVADFGLLGRVAVVVARPGISAPDGR